MTNKDQFLFRMGVLETVVETPDDIMPASSFVLAAESRGLGTTMELTDVLHQMDKEASIKYTASHTIQPGPMLQVYLDFYRRVIAKINAVAKEVK